MGSITNLYKGAEPGVKHILYGHNAARANNMALIVLYWTEIQRIPIPPEIIDRLLKDAIHPETICRIKRELQSSGLYLPTKDVQEKKAEQQQEMWGSHKK